MLGSITPLGERGRNQRWGLTVSAYVVGAVFAGALIGGTLGFLSEIVARVVEVPRSLSYGILAGIGAGGIIFDLRLFRLRLPSTNRQVDDEWLYRYRGWVYGFGFGVQLGLGLITIVTISSIYWTYAFAFFTANVISGAVIGGVFGFVRSATVLASVNVREPQRLLQLDRRLTRWDGASRRIAIASEIGLIVTLLAAI